MRHAMIRKLTILLIVSLVSFLNGIGQEKTPAFPGAEGYGKHISGGRGGDVVYVTHLKDNTDQWGAGYAGSLRAALETPGNHAITIIFKVGGVIAPQATLECSRSNITLAGQTALGDGICIRGMGIQFSGNNIIVRHMRFRVGDEVLQNDPALTFSNGKNAIFDHCSFSWSTEENVNITDVDSVTIQWCINSESLYKSSHPKGARGYAAQWGGEHSSYHHNLLAHHSSRMPRQNGNTSNDHHLTWDYRNNVHYNWGNTEAFYGGGIEELDGTCNSNLIDNYYLPGPATTTSKSSQYFCAPSGGRPAVVGSGNDYLFGYGKWYLEGNVMYDNPGKTSDNFSGLSGPEEHKAVSIFEVAPIITSSAEQAYIDVLAKAGATLPGRDSIDIRIINEVKTQTATYGGVYGTAKGIIDSHLSTKPAGAASDWNAWGIYSTVNKSLAPTDTDEDGMPDWWETANGLDPSDINDGKALADDNSGYTNLETYLNSVDVGRTGPNPIKSVKNIGKFSIYPNPAIDYFRVSDISRPELIEIYSIVGVKVLEFKSNISNIYSVESLEKGQYVVKLNFANGQFAVERLFK